MDPLAEKGFQVFAGGLADGLYLVRVDGGRAVSVLSASGPGRMTAASPRQPGT